MTSTTNIRRLCAVMIVIASQSLGGLAVLCDAESGALVPAFQSGPCCTGAETSVPERTPDPCRCCHDARLATVAPSATDAAEWFRPLLCPVGDPSFLRRGAPPRGEGTRARQLAPGRTDPSLVGTVVLTC